MDRGEALRTLAESLDGVPVKWGVDDCSVLAAQWAVDEMGREIDWPYYSTESEAQALIDAAGGLVALWTDLARKAGLYERTDDPQIGDIGIVLTSMGEVGGIFVHGGLFMWRHKHGVTMLGPRRCTIKRVWQV